MLKKPGESMTKNCPSANPDPLMMFQRYSAVGCASLTHDNELFTAKFSCCPLNTTFRGQSDNITKLMKHTHSMFVFGEHVYAKCNYDRLLTDNHNNAIGIFRNW